MDLQWQQTFVNYLLSRGIYDSFYWAINPEDLNTGGVYDHAYDPVSNSGGWGTWLIPNPSKRDLLTHLWYRRDPSPPPTQTPRPTTTPEVYILGDVNGDKVVNIVDALLIAQYYVGLPVEINITAANVRCSEDDSVSIVDALVVAQYYVGLIDKFCE